MRTIVLCLILAGCAAPGAEKSSLTPTIADSQSIAPSGEVGSPLQKAAEPAPRPLTPATAELLASSLSAERIRLGETAKLSFRLKNSGELDGSLAVQLMSNGEVAEEKSYRLFAGAIETGFFEFRPSSRGDYSLSLAASVLGEQGRTKVASEIFHLKVVLPADIRIMEATVDVRETPVARPVSVSVDLVNQGEETGAKEVRLFVNGQVVQTQSVSLAGGARQQLTFSYENEARGTYGLRVEDFDLGSVLVYLPATFEVLTFHASSPTPQLGDSLHFVAEIRNVGDKGGTATGSFRLGGETLHVLNQYIGPQQSTRVETASAREVDFVDSTRAEIWLGEEAARHLFIQPQRPAIRFDKITTPYNSNWSCYDEAFTSVTLLNGGAGRDKGLVLQFFVDGKKLLERPVGDLAAGAYWPSGSVKLAPVVDDCGRDDHHVLVVKVTNKFGHATESGAISFVL